MKRILSISCLLLWSANAMANGIICSKDERPVDGNYHEVKLSKNGSLYDLTETVITAGFGGPVETRKTTLVEGLNCNIDGLVAYCFRLSTEMGDPRNSIAKFIIVEETRLNTLAQSKAEKSAPYVKIEVGSPLISELRKNFEFSVSEQFGGCRSL